MQFILSKKERFYCDFQQLHISIENDQREAVFLWDVAPCLG
jgi:hypothetical protein